MSRMHQLTDSQSIERVRSLWSIRQGRQAVHVEADVFRSSRSIFHSLTSVAVSARQRLRQLSHTRRGISMYSGDRWDDNRRRAQAQSDLGDDTILSDLAQGRTLRQRELHAGARARGGNRGCRTAGPGGQLSLVSAKTRSASASRTADLVLNSADTHAISDSEIQRSKAAASTASKKPEGEC